MNKIIILTILIFGILTINSVNANSVNCENINNNIKNYSDYKTKVDNLFNKISKKDEKSKKNYFTKIDNLTEKYLNKLDKNKQNKLYAVIGYLKCENDELLLNIINNRDKEIIRYDSYLHQKKEFLDFPAYKDIEINYETNYFSLPRHNNISIIYFESLASC